jgi:hypothetical protein
MDAYTSVEDAVFGDMMGRHSTGGAGWCCGYIILVDRKGNTSNNWAGLTFILAHLSILHVLSFGMLI